MSCRTTVVWGLTVLRKKQIFGQNRVASCPGSFSMRLYRNLCWVSVVSASAQAFSSSSNAMSSASCSATPPVEPLPGDVPELLRPIQDALVNSWPRLLYGETTENYEKSLRQEGLTVETNTNQTRRPIFNGHYVLVRPTGLGKPRLVLSNPELLHSILGLTREQIDADESSSFAAWVSGNLNVGESWATPYALSIMGTRYSNNCPYGTGI